MKVFNLTDVETPALVQRGLMRQTFAVGGTLVTPGDGIEVPLEARAVVAHGIEHLVEVGALAIDEPPATYLAHKAPAHAGPPPAAEAPVPPPPAPKEE
jgi:hypothetical protein